MGTYVLKHTIDWDWIAVACEESAANTRWNVLELPLNFQCTECVVMHVQGILNGKHYIMVDEYLKNTMEIQLPVYEPLRVQFLNNVWHSYRSIVRIGKNYWINESPQTIMFIEKSMYFQLWSHSVNWIRRIAIRFPHKWTPYACYSLIKRKIAANIKSICRNKCKQMQYLQHVIFPAKHNFQLCGGIQVRNKACHLSDAMRWNAQRFSKRWWWW